MINTKPFHRIDTSLLNSTVNVALIGAGGTGSMIFSGLVRLSLSMLACGHPGGLHVKVYDPDKVSDANVGRQLFYRTDIGANKAEVMVNRANIMFGLDFEAVPRTYKPPRNGSAEQIIISCVDSRKSRSMIKKSIEDHYFHYFIDCGNGPDYGQVLMGKRDELELLPMPWNEHPDLFDDSIPEDDTPSCSLMEALEDQELFINQDVATACLILLWKLFRHGGTSIRGFYVNQDIGTRVPIPIKEVKKAKRKVKIRLLEKASKLIKILKLIVTLEVDEDTDEQEFIDRTYDRLLENNNWCSKLKDVDIYDKNGG